MTREEIRKELEEIFYEYPDTLPKEVRKAIKDTLVFLEGPKETSELKPCPFCGGKAHVMDMGFPHWIYCEDCGAKVHGRVIGDEEASIKAWNRRA